MEQTKLIDRQRTPRWFCVTAAAALAVAGCTSSEENTHTPSVSATAPADVCSQLVAPEIYTDNESETAVTANAIKIACAALEDIAKDSSATVYAVDDLPGAGPAATYGYGLPPGSKTLGPKASIELTTSARRLYINLSNGGVDGIPNTVVLSGLLTKDNPIVLSNPTNEPTSNDFQTSIRSGQITVDNITASSGISRQVFIISSDLQGGFIYKAERDGQSQTELTPDQALQGIQQILSEVRSS